jgi:diguanylate cyclase (GGDEF)-like protein
MSCSCWTNAEASLYLDIRTLLVATIVVCSVLGPISLAFGPAQHMQPSRLWGAGLVAVAAGLALLGLQGLELDYFSRVIGSGLLALALTFAQASARAALGKTARDTFGWTLLASFVLAFLILEGMSGDPGLRHLLGMSLLGFLAFRSASEFEQSSKLREGRPMRAIAVILLLFGAGMVLEGALVAADPGAPFEPGAIETLLLVGLIVGLLLGTIVLMWVMTERISYRMRQLVSVDPLTGALNRRAFIRRFRREVSRTRRRSDSPFAILLVDLDHLRRINDAYGHRTGDRVLEKTVEVVRGTIRDYDLIGRLEGDAFVLLLPGTTSEGAATMAERVRQEIERKASVLSELKNPVSASIGVAVFGEHGDNWDAILRSADGAARKAKESGGNRVEVALPVPSARITSGGSPIPAVART